MILMINWHQTQFKGKSQQKHTILEKKQKHLIHTPIHTYTTQTKKVQQLKYQRRERTIQMQLATHNVTPLT